MSDLTFREQVVIAIINSISNLDKADKDRALDLVAIRAIAIDKEVNAEYQEGFNKDLG